MAIDHGLRELPGEQPDDVADAGAEHLADADLLGPPLGGEGGEAEQAEAGDDHGEDREAGEDLGARGFRLVELDDDVLAEHRPKKGASVAIRFQARSTAAANLAADRHFS